MIPHGRDAVNGQEAAQMLGKSYKTWRNARMADKLGLRPFNPGRRTLLYDRAQVEAACDGRPLPAWPVGTTQHPADLLDEQDAAEYLGVSYATVRHDRATERLGDAWTQIGGVAHIRRGDLDELIAARPGRGVGGGRPRSIQRSE
ncbi:DNA-binding protein [Sphaerisporangium album]|uniref:DNA-binding protein n=1 Tax=Sphaerisporangium album TaxID=509200 RepID=A0A367ENB5_9ACTN|nr:DNA-binding protein [Sphaerisporangium album]RCG19085.1 DNA-binding protein [Sphaerisporangium album]